MADDQAIKDLVAYINSCLSGASTSTIDRKAAPGGELSMSYVAHDESDFVPPAEVEEAELYHPKTFIGKYIWSQDAKVIAIQYAITAMGIGFVALVLSWLMRLQLGFPGASSPSSTPATTCSSSPCTA